MSTSIMKTLSLLNILLLTLTTLISSAPTTISETTLSLAEEPFNLTSRSPAWAPGQPVTVWISSGRRSIYYTLCVPKVDDPHMCIVSFAQDTEKDSALMWIYDNQCRQVSFNGEVTRDSLASRFGMFSQLPLVTVIEVNRSWNPTWVSGVKVWYGAYNNLEPWLGAPQQWLPQLNRDIIEGHDGSPRPWFVFRVPFQCG